MVAALAKDVTDRLAYTTLVIRVPEFRGLVPARQVVWLSDVYSAWCRRFGPPPGPELLADLRPQLHILRRLLSSVEG